jgi:uncharacterized protein (TIGR03083 family)
MNERPLTRRQEQYLERLRAARERLLNSFAGVDSQELSSEPTAGDWTVKDLLGHVVSWNEEFRACIRSIQQGGHPGFERSISGEDDFDRWNQEQAAQKRAWTWERILADLERDYQEAVDLILGLEPGDLRKRGVTPWKQAAVKRPAEISTADTESIETLITYHWRHMNQHARMIERWRRGR